MTSWRSWVDVFLVARFEMLRAIRTRRALVLIATYLLINLGGGWIFIQALSEIEGQIAGSLGVMPTRWPGALTEQLRSSDQMKSFISFIVGSDAHAEGLLQLPFLATFQLWLAFLFMPFLAAMTASETLAPDVASRAVRFELLRTGRAELVAGRFVGQVGLTLIAVVASLVGMWGLGIGFMVQQDPIELAWGLMRMGVRAVPFALPFLGMGAAASQLTASVAWARMLALSAAAGSWIVYGVLTWVERWPWTWVADALLPLFPQSWMGGLWRLDAGLLLPGLVCLTLSVAWVALGYVVFSRRDL